MPDIIIRGGMVIDGTGQPAQRADVAIEGDRISEVGDLSALKAAREIDAAGLVVTPGFIDVHNHSDGWLVRKTNLTPKTLQGFTTEVLMADGIGYAPVNQRTAREWLFYLRSLNGLRVDDYSGWETIEEYLQAIDGHTAQNCCAHVPYANCRSLARGFGSGPVDDFQMREIQRQIRIGMEAGAVGVSTGLDYIVQHFCTTDELVEAMSAMAPYDGLYVTHVRYKKGLLPAIEEAVDIGIRAGVRVHISHLKAPSGNVSEEVIEYLDQVQNDVDISFDVYPYQPGSTMLNYLLPYEVWEDGPLAAIGKLNDPILRERFEAGLEAMRLPLDKLRIAWVLSAENKHLQGLTLAEFIDQSPLPAPDALLGLLIEERLSVLCVFDEGDDRLIEPFLTHDLFMMGTDGIYCEGGRVHPRMFGSVGRFLGRIVRDQGLMTLERAIHHMTSCPADRFRLTDRGVLRKAALADVVVFDATTIIDEATYEMPAQPVRGIHHVLVNGVPIVSAGQPLDLASPPGRYIRARSH